MNILHAEELRAEHMRKQQRRIQTYLTVLNKCQKRMITSSKLDQYECIFTIPDIIHGQPRIETKACLVFLIFKLTRYGYHVTALDHNTILISWRRYTQGGMLPP
jgi:hypothetical protein